jgi:hypothetical protein
MQAPDQGKGLIAEREGRIKLHTISNPAISLDRQISSTQRSKTMVDPPKDQIKSCDIGYTSARSRAGIDCRA